MLDAELHPLWAAGITGKGQVIGCGDSGLGEAGQGRGRVVCRCILHVVALLLALGRLEVDFCVVAWRRAPSRMPRLRHVTPHFVLLACPCLQTCTTASLWTPQ